jgi:hypothetical protein
MFIIYRIDGEASPEAEQVQLNGEKEAETREGETLFVYCVRVANGRLTLNA